MPSRFVIALGDVRPVDQSLVGGKAWGLSRLLRMGLPVPRGIVLTTEAFDLSGASLEDLSEPGLAERCRKIQESIRAGALPAEVEEVLRDVRGPVAVRSSATVEDGAASAFAGVYHSELDVVDVAAAVRACWARAFGYAAVTHAMRNNIDPRRVKLALVIHEMVPADRSGVLFTQDPTGADPESAVITVTQGVGEKLMQGEVAGNSLAVRRKNPDLPDPVLKKLVKIGLAVERKLGRPQDIEWAVHRDRLWFLQTRPITTLESGPEILWTREISEERFPHPISPLGWSALQLLLEVNQKTLAQRFGLVARRPDDVACTIGHYVYTNQKFFSIPGSLRPNPLTQARFLPEFLAQLWDGARYATSAIGKPFGLRWLALTKTFQAFVFPHAREIRESWDAHLAGLLREMDSFATVEPERRTTPRLWEHKARMEEVARRYMEPDLAIYVVKTACSWMVGKIGEKLGAGRDFLVDLTGGVDNRTLAMNEEMETLFQGLDAERVRLLREGRTDELAKRMNGSLEDFVRRNGHLTTNWDLMEPTWGEAPEKILHLLRGYASTEHRRSFREHHADRRERTRAARAKTRAALPPWVAPFFEELLSTLHDFMRIDEEHHFYCSRLFRPMRRVCREFGKRLAAARTIDSPDDVWFLSLQEVEEAFANPFPRRHLVETRRASFARSRTTRPPDRFQNRRPLTPDPLPLDSDILRGVGASPGSAVGTVRVVETPEDVGAFRPGEILVTSAPNPAWTPVYAVAGALVTSTGSILSHGLVSAREYHLPAVIGIADAPKRLVTGQKVRVDGYAGTVVLERA